MKVSKHIWCTKGDAKQRSVEGASELAANTIFRDGDTTGIKMLRSRRRLHFAMSSLMKQNTLDCDIVRMITGVTGSKLPSIGGIILCNNIKH